MGPIPPAGVEGCGIDVGLGALQPGVAGASSRAFLVVSGGAGVEAFLAGGFPSVAAKVVVGVGERVGRGDGEGEGGRAMGMV